MVGPAHRAKPMLTSQIGVRKRSTAELHLATHTPLGSSLDLSGAVLFLTMMNCGADDKLLSSHFPGTALLNLVDLIRTSTQKNLCPTSKRTVWNGDTSSSLPLACHRLAKKPSLLGSLFPGHQRSKSSGRGETVCEVDFKAMEVWKRRRMTKTLLPPRKFTKQISKMVWKWSH